MKEKPKWYNYYFAKWFPIRIEELITIILVAVAIGVLCKVI